MKNAVKIRNNTESLWNIGPLSRESAEHYKLVPGEVVEVPLEFLKKFDKHPILEAALRDGKLEIVKAEAPKAAAATLADQISEVK